MSRRPLTGQPTLVISLMASVAWSVPMAPGTGPRTPASSHRAQFAAAGHSGNRHLHHPPLCRPHALHMLENKPVVVATHYHTNVVVASTDAAIPCCVDACIHFTLETGHCTV
jgi:hypothetical protein